jgi:hypothetical protein
MKSIIKTDREERNFPKLMISLDKDLVVCFLREDRGTIVSERADSLGPNGVGYYQEDWDMEEFEDFHGAIILSND